MAKMSQCELVYNYMKDFGSITTMEAFKDLGVARLSARIKDLRESGINIVTTYETAKNRYNQSTTYARYKLQ